MRLLNGVTAVGFVGVVLVFGLPREASAARQVATSGVVRVDDDSIEARTAASLKKSSILAPRDIDVDVKDGIVTLTGTVRTANEKARAGRLALGPGVIRVYNRIDIDPRIDESKIDAAGEKTKAGLNKAVDATVSAAKKSKEAVQKGVGKAEQGVGKAAEATSDAAGKVADKASDASVTTAVKARMTNEPLLADAAIDVDTVDHVVTLRGTVRSHAARTRAGELAGGTDGVTRVANQIVVTDR
jgi:hyperosmotically inducible periplasmic protein